MNHNPQKIPRVSPYEIWYNISVPGAAARNMNLIEIIDH
jgi:hypothetical protein